MSNVIVESPNQLTAQTKSALETKLHALLKGDEHSFSYHIDPNLIGGLRLTIDTKVVDLSIQARLQQLKRAILD